MSEAGTWRMGLSLERMPSGTLGGTTMSQQRAATHTIWLLAIVLAAMVVGVAALLLPMTPAHAVKANAHVYAVAPQWGGWCVGPLNKVKWVQWTNNTTGGTGGDGGDDIAWMPIKTGVKNNVVIAVKCKYATPSGMSYIIKPTRNKQTFWFRLDGTFKSN